MARTRQTERRRPPEPDDAEDEASAYEDEEDAEIQRDAYQDEEDASYDDDYEGDADEDRSSDEDGSSPGKDGTRRSKPRMSAAGAAQAALRHVAELTAKEPTGITALESSGDGWAVGIEVVEDKRVPSSADILAIYEAQIDDEDGSLMSYRRVRRYSRGQGDRGS
jgi:hypothetical protein